MHYRASDLQRRVFITRQLEARFGPLPPSAIAQLQALSSDRLTDLGCALLSATSLEELGLGGGANGDS